MPEFKKCAECGDLYLPSEGRVENAQVCQVCEDRIEAEEWQYDRAYQSGYAYASGCQD